MEIRVTLGGYFYGEKGQTFQMYTEAFKLKAVRTYLDGSSSYTIIAEQQGIRSCTQLKVWVRKWKNGDSFDERKNEEKEMNPRKGRSRTSFGSVEEESDYLKAQVDI